MTQIEFTSNKFTQIKYRILQKNHSYENIIF